jgi:PAS domain S-box-containing protein
MISSYLPFHQIKARWRQLPLVRRGAITITIPLMCLVTSLGINLWLRQRALQMQVLVDHTETVLLESNKLLVEILNAETSVRGFYVNKKADFLQPYEQALTVLPDSFSRLNNLLKDNPKQIQRVEKLKDLANQKLELLTDGIQQTRKSNLDQAQLNLRLIRGKALMDEFRILLDEVKTEEQQLLNLRRQSLQNRRELNTLVILLGVIISALGAALATRLFRDLSQELRQRELRLRETNNLLQVVFANVVDGVVVLDAQKTIESINQAAEHMFGYSSKELVGNHWMILLAQGASFETSSADLIQMDCLWQATGRRKDGTWFPVEVSVSEIEFDDRFLVILRDITERQQNAANLQAYADELAALNTMLRSTNATLSERNRELDQFTYVVAHDLKAPLRAIANLSSWIEEDLAGDLSPESQKHMQLLRGRAQRMEALLNGLLDYSRIGRIEAPIETIDITKLLSDVVETIQPPSTFQIDIAPDMPVLQGRRLFLQEVFLNLIENAVNHHVTKVGTVKISVEDQDDRYEFAIADDGQGIDPRFHNKIYTIFQTLQSRDTHESPGVGLAIVRKIVEIEGGTIHLDSAVGKGATFRFTWLKQPLLQSKQSLASLPIDRSV